MLSTVKKKDQKNRKDVCLWALTTVLKHKIIQSSITALTHVANYYQTKY